ncbi:MAG TPA: 30S ribosomal protein S20 [Nitrospirae bacterium]|nr:30S ribosomal protein S20 [bacterium BMS3Abin06]HDH13110.1 30S ribosomal protein S20 [Nitrospirota bacterium]HDZ02871.1 30S ribosomal protein S20 [Nitrospirota bacterium]
MPAKAAPKKNKSAIKRARQTEVRTLKNRSIKNMIKTLSKKVEKEVKNKSRESAEAALTKAVSAIDKAAKKGVLHRNTASRKVSRLSRLVNSMLHSEAA